jgi:predicted acetyltransferase
MSPSHTVVPLGPDRRADLVRLDQTAFVIPDEGVDHEVTYLEWDRTAGVVDEPGDRLVGMHTVFTLGLSTPDGPDGAGIRRVPMAGLSWVAVDPAHRRRGVLRAMIRHHLHGLHEERREAVSGLYASEAAIYGRFGYGSAVSGLRLELPRGAALRPLPSPLPSPLPGEDRDGTVSVDFVTADVERHADLVAGLYEQACSRRPGMVWRSAALTRSEVADPPRRRQRGEPLRLLVAESAGGPTGYVLLRRELTWADGTPSGTARIDELVACDAATARALWSSVTDLDLITRTRTPALPADDPLLTLLVDTRAAQPRRQDGLWLRLVDVDRALEQRTYAREVDVVLAVTDELCPWNARRWRLSGGPQGATCSPTTDDADLALDVRDLGAAYVGGVALAALAAAGLVTELRAGAVARLSTALQGAVEPASTFLF